MNTSLCDAIFIHVLYTCIPNAHEKNNLHVCVHVHMYVVFYMC